jgi:phage tail sheath protein FI
MAFQRPGVYVQETLNPIQSTVGPNSDTIAAFVGSNDRGPTTPTLVTSWSQYTNLFGTWNLINDNDLPIAVYMFFSNGGSRAYVQRVVGAGAVSAVRTLNDRAGTPLATLRLTAKNQGTWGNDLNVTITNSTTTGYFNVTLYYGGTTDAFIVERYTDLSMINTDPRYAVSAINGASTYVTALDLDSATVGTSANPALVSNQALATGASGSAVTTISDFSAFDVIKQSLVLHVPGNTDATTVNAAISYAESRDDVFVIVDGLAATAAAQITLTDSYTASSYAAVYYPPLVIADPTVGVGGATGQTRTVGAGGAVAGLYSTTDASRGVFKAPAGLQARLAGATSVAPLTNAELDSLNSNAAAVNAIKFVSGSGIVVMGARTLKGGYIDKYVPVRRTLIYLRKALTDLTEFAIFEPNDPALWRRIDSTVSSFLTSFWSQGGLRGSVPAQAFFVKVDSTNNPQASIDNGEVHLEVGVALQRPAEFVIIKIGQFDGGSTVTVA